MGISRLRHTLSSKVSFLSKSSVPSVMTNFGADGSNENSLSSSVIPRALSVAVPPLLKVKFRRLKKRVPAEPRVLSCTGAKVRPVVLTSAFHDTQMYGS